VGCLEKAVGCQEFTTEVQNFLGGIGGGKRSHCLP